ncbi:MULTISPECIES: ribonuclease III [Cycloclasticus]|jgi:ribonuclease-3|uniref:Ribonuclease 3 n=1 Tax=Cycloclasticus zancles 78-ME TaxID=1198232 RepID=S5TG86_9GAMM|nr:MULTISPECIES: ribonuclease III [Cycloclasticus]AGS39847.1 Ribonuclease III [Cycloclasticus zancles 78-ME]MBV1899984.1 ribonuclease III [Cycloclasticus sp.]MDF1828927.1 ribonuclease III [Cycloclasticus pugetii]SHJ37130.1 RNAse III [Cycloclasticus pugetii]|tara:strand:- start:272 stop:949 length:678 start_codon:yes stop_codon:yes gene_type:complete
MLSFDASRLQKKINTIFDDHALLEQALTHRSISKNNNERLEFLGDAILGFIIADAIYEKFPAADEGVMSRLRAHLVNGESLANIAKMLQLSDELVLGPGEMKSGGKHRASILSDAVEALIGAMYKDKGLNETRSWVLTIFKTQLDSLSLDTASKDPKTQLQEYLQARGIAVPRYSVISTTGLDHNQQFKVECQVDGVEEVVCATASSRKKAEQKAASKILEGLLS